MLPSVLVWQKMMLYLLRNKQFRPTFQFSHRVACFVTLAMTYSGQVLKTKGSMLAMAAANGKSMSSVSLVIICLHGGHYKDRCMHAVFF